jgi:hypothetical protein
MEPRELEILVCLSQESINYNIEPLIASKYTHNGTTDISLSSDGVNAYIPIAIEFPQPDQSSFVGLAPAENASFTYYLNSAEFTINAYDTKKSLFPPMIIGLIVGVLVLLILGIAICYCYCCKKRRASKPDAQVHGHSNGHAHGHAHGNVHGHPNGHHPGHQPEMRHPVHIHMDIY